VYRLIVFDLDGTLIDSRRDIADAANAVLQLYGADSLPEDEIGRMVGDGAATLVNRAFAAAGRDAPPDALERFLTIYDDHLLAHTRPYPGAADVLGTLSTQAQVALLTNKPNGATRRILSGLQLAHFFSDAAVVGGDGPYPRKPHPAGLQHLMTSAAAAPAQTLLVGDSIIDLRTARHASADICIARYGFGYEGFPSGALVPHDRVIDDLTELLRL
jgi:phosphoglycolate phosphatase